MTRYLLKWPPIEVLPDGTRRQLTEEEALGEIPERPQGGYFQFGWPVGRDSRNERADVLRAQTLLSHAGYFDMERTEGPTGWYGKPLELGIRKFQRDNGLTIDGYMEPGGETLTALEQQFGTVFAPHRPPSLKIIDEHHERRARGEPGLLHTERGKGAPFGVRLEMATTKEQKPLPPGMRPVETVPRMSVGEASTEGEIQFASSATASDVGGVAGSDKSLPKPQARPLPRGRLGLIYKTIELLGDAPKKAREAIYGNFVNEALGEGILGGFGIVERHETENTRLSSRILREECMDYLKSLTLPDGVSYKHVAGAVDDKGKEFPEKAMKDGSLKGGGGHSFADLLIRIGKTYLGFNSATENRLRGRSTIPIPASADQSARGRRGF